MVAKGSPKAQPNIRARSPRLGFARDRRGFDAGFFGAGAGLR
jgi:hypothetical protein